jgi:UDP-N-acetylglucosamine diphosphorylase/glucosamine-1-phosphate N-acetyltransferase
MKLLNYIWDFVQVNGGEILTDYRKRKTAFSKKKSKVDRRAALINPKQIYLGKKVSIEPQVVLNAKNGPIIIDDNSTLQAFTRIEGPAYIGKNTILYGAKVSAGCSIGPECRVGGEIQNSIILGYSNKYHDGFLGHSYLGEWVNLGAGTTTSDLKNNYSTIRVEVPGGNFDTGLKKVGSLLGDHVKTGIGTLLNTGAVLGLGSNIFGGGMPGIKFVPSFLWGDDSRLAEYNWDKFVANARTVMERRKLTLSDAERHALHKVFELTKSERIF